MAEVLRLNIDPFVDFANEAHADVGKYRIQMMLAPNKMRFNAYCVPVCIPDQFCH